MERNCRLFILMGKGCWLLEIVLLGSVGGFWDCKVLKGFLYLINEVMVYFYILCDKFYGFCCKL